MAIQKITAPGAQEHLGIQLENTEILQFDFDTSNASFERAGNDLVISFDNGGTLIINDFFVVGDSASLPDIVLDAETTLTAEQFLLGIDPDMDITPAGPAGPNSSGIGEYDSDPGNLLDGLNRLGTTDPFFWSGQRDQTEEYQPIEVPGGDFGLGAGTDVGGMLSAGVFEDGRPSQNIYGDSAPQIPAQISFTPNFTGTTVATAVHLSGFHVGSIVEIGQPGDPAYQQIVISSTGQMLTFSPDAFTSPGVYVLPPANSDLDMNINVSVDVLAQSSGLTGTLNGAFVITIDAVADLTNLDDASAAADMSEHVLGSEDVTQGDGYDKGYITNEHETRVEAGQGAGQADVTVNFKGTFGDFEDSSEAHSLLIEVKPGLDLNPASLPAGYTLTGQVTLADANGNPVTFYKIEVDSSLVQSGSGTVDLDVTFEFSGVAEDTAYNWQVGTLSEETNLSGGEISWDNNSSHMLSGGTGAPGNPGVTLDVVDSTLTVRVGWASEGSDNSKHIDGTHNPNWNQMDGDTNVATNDVNSSSTSSSGAPINISIAGSGNSSEFITEITLGFGSSAEGTLTWAASLPAGYTVTDNGDGTYSIATPGAGTTDLSALGLHFNPGAGTSDADVTMHFEVTVQNGAGATANYSGQTEIIIDAVADRSLDVEATVEAEVQAGEVGSTLSIDGTPQSSSGWETDTHTLTGQEATYKTSVTVGTSFPDIDGSENHYLLVTQPDGWTVSESGSGSFISDGVTYEYSTENINGTGYIKIDVTDAVNNSADGKIELDLPLETTNSHTGDETITLKTGSLSEETVGTSANDKLDEHDAANNQAIREDGTDVAHTIDRVESKLEVKVGWASEGNSDAKHQGLGAGVGNSYQYGPQYFDKNSTEAENRINTGAPIDINLSGTASNSSDYIHSFTLKLSGAGGNVTDGRLCITNGSGGLTEITDGMAITAGSGASLSTYTVAIGQDGSYVFTLTSGPGVTSTTQLGKGGIVYSPEAGSFDYSEIQLAYEVTVKNGSGSSVDFTGGSTIVLDAVADRPTVSEQNVEYPGLPGSPSGSATNAKPGDTVQVSGKVSFPDASGGEEHSFSFKALNNGTINGGTLTVTDADGNQLTYTITHNIVDGTYSYEVNGTTYTVQPDASGKITIPLASDSSTVESDFSLTLDAESTANGGLVLTGHASVGGGSGDGTGGYEYDVNNNTASSQSDGNIPIIVDGEVTAPQVAIGRAYENAAGNADEAEYRPGSDDVIWSHIGFGSGGALERDLSADPDSAKKLADLQKYSAKVTINGDEKNVGEGEFVSGFKISFKAHDKNNPEATGQFMLGDTLLPLATGGFVAVSWNGDEFNVQCSVDADGNVTLTLLAGADGADLSEVPLFYVPGTDHSHVDIEFDVAISVTNEGNNFTRIFDNDGDETSASDLATELKGDLQTPGHGVIPPDQPGDPSFISGDNGKVVGNDQKAEIDAVADQPEFNIPNIVGKDIPTGAIGLDADNDGKYDKVVPGQNVTIPLQDLNLHGDTADGSEHHYLFVEFIGDHPLQNIVLHLSDGNTITLGVSDSTLQPLNNLGDPGAFYHAFDLEQAVDKYNTTNGTSYNPGDVGTVDVTISTPSGATGSTNISVGILNREEWATVNSDSELEAPNNLSWAQNNVTINYSSAGSVGVDIINKGEVYENATENAHIGDETTSPAKEIAVSFGDVNDELTGFSMSLQGESDTGSLWLFASNDDYQAYQADIASGTDPWTALADHAIEFGPGETIGFDDIKGMVGQDAEGRYTGSFGGNIVYMPGAGSYSGVDPTINYNVAVRDTESGDISSSSGSTNITTDAVAQKPEISGFIEENQNTALDGQAIETTLEATFHDSDGSTGHYFLVEAEPGWTIEYSDGNGGWTTLDFDAAGTYMSENGVSYYKIPASPDFTGTGDTANASVDVRITPPDNPLYWHMLADNGALSGDRPYEIQVGALSEDTDTQDGEITFHNNMGMDEGGKISGNLHKPGGDWIFEQTKPLYEDNQPDQHLGQTNTESAEFVLSHPGTDHAIVTVPDGLVLSGPGVTQQLDGTYKVELNGDVRVELSFGEPNQFADQDIDFSGGLHVDFQNATGESLNQQTIDIIVDAVADQPAEVGSGVINSYDNDNLVGGVVSGNISKDSIIGGGEDNVAKFTVKADFGDSADGSENHYLLVEKTPNWELDSAGGLTLADGSVIHPGVETIYIDGTAYYQIDVTGSEGEGPYTLGMSHVGVKNEGDSDLTNVGGHDGIGDYKINVGAMSKENNTSGAEFTGENNTSVDLGHEVILQISPIDSNGAAKVSGGRLEGDDITIQFNGIATDKQDVLDTMTVGVNAKGGGTADGILYLQLADGTMEQLNLDNSGQCQIDNSYMGGLSDGSIQLVYKPNANSHEDVIINWNGTVHDQLSGASGSISGNETIVYDAVADPSINTIDKFDDNGQATQDGDYAAVIQSGKIAIVTLNAEFTDHSNSVAGGSESHYAVIEQKNLGYTLVSVKLIAADGTEVIVNYPSQSIETRLDANGTPYFAVKLPDGQDYKVEFSISTPGASKDTNFEIGVGTIVTDSTLNSTANGEPEYTNNWNSSIDNVVVHTGVVETKEDDFDITASGREDDFCVLNFPDLSGNNERFTITIGEGDLKGGGLYQFDGTAWILLAAVDGTYVLDGSGQYAYQGKENLSGKVEIPYTATVTDNASGAEKDFTEDLNINIEISGVADAPTGIKVEQSAMEAVPGEDAAIFTATVSATFSDTSSENHYFLFALPEGMSIVSPGVETITIDGNEYYCIQVGGGYQNPSINVEFKVDASYDPENGTYEVYGRSKELTTSGVEPEDDDDRFAMSDAESITLPPLPEVINPFDLSDTFQCVGNVDPSFLLTGEAGNTLALASVAGNNGAEAIDPATGGTVEGLYGTLTLYPDGSYEYTLNPHMSTDPLPINAQDKFTIVGGDGSTSETGILVLNIDNTKPMMVGSEGNDALTAPQGSANGYYLLGGAGDDIIYGSAGDDVIYGGSGNDVIYCGGGNNVINGGEGNDVFAFVAEDAPANTVDTIIDFNMGGDKLLFVELFNDPGISQDEMHDVFVEMLNNDEISISASSDCLQLDVNIKGQDVVIHLSESLDQTCVELIQAQDANAQALLLQQMITSITG